MPTRGLRDWSHALSIAAVLCAIGVWAVATSLGWVPSLLLPSPRDLLETLGDLIHDGYRQVPLWYHVLVSVARAFTAFGAAAAVGIPLGLAMGLFRPLYALVDPFVEFVRPLPKLALIPLVILWFGIGELSKFVLIFLSTVLTVIVSSSAAVQSVKEGRLRAARVLGVNRYQLFRHVILPSTLPEVFTGMRVAIGIGWTTLIAAEMIAATSGVGWMVLNASSYLRTDVVLLGIIIIGSIGYLLDIVLVRVQKRIVPWMGKE